MASDLNTVLVPMYLVRSAIARLRVLSDTVARNDLRAVAQDARVIVRSLERLAEAQSPPRGERVVVKAQLPKATERTWRRQEREDRLRALLEQQVLPRFAEADEACRGEARFHLVLTCVRA